MRRVLGGLGDLVALVELVEHGDVDALRAEPDHVVELPPHEVAVARGAAADRSPGSTHGW